MLRNRDLVPDKKPERAGKGRIIALFFGGLATAIVLTLIIRWYFFFGLRVTTDQMEPGIARGEKVYVSRMVEASELKHGDVILIRHPENPAYYMLRRVIALPGERVRILERTVLVNGKPITSEIETKIQAEASKAGRPLPRRLFPRDNTPETEVKPGHLYVLADNRKTGLDSRLAGQVPANLLVGRVVDF